MPNVSGSAEIHSVILNLNKNLANNQGSSFKQIVNQQLEIKPNTLVALYSGNIVRKPIVIEEDVLLDINMPSLFPTKDMSTIPSDTDNIDDIVLNQVSTITVTVPKGYYSKLSFGRSICDLANAVIEDSGLYQVVETNIDPENNGNDMEIYLPYRLYFEARDNNVFLGLRRVKVEEADADNSLYGETRLSIKQLDDKLTNTSNITIAVDNEQLIFRASARTAKFNSYTMGNNPILPHCYSHLNDPNVSPVDVGFTMFNLNIDPVASSTEVIEMCYVMNNSYFCSNWAVETGAKEPKTSKLVDVNEKPDVVNGMIGAYVQVSVDTGNIAHQFMTIYCNELLFDIDDTSFNGSTTVIAKYQEDATMRALTSIDLTAYDFTDKLGGIFCEVYAEDVPITDVPSNTQAVNDIVEDAYRYYFRFYLRTPYSNVNELTLIFDSKNLGVEIPNILVDSAYMFHSLKSDVIPDKFYCGGLCPQFYFKNSLTDLTVSNPIINSNIGYDSVSGTFKYLTGIRGYTFQPTTDEDAKGLPLGYTNTKNTSSLQNVLGVGDNRQDTGTLLTNEETIFNPSKFPSNKSMAGLTRISSDKQRYNIELNLPIKAYNTTEQTTNDIGQTRTIIYNTNTVDEAQEDNPTVGLINKELEPNNLKYLSLNNPDPIKLNTLDVQIRRAKTNELADEITDASLELIFYSEGNPHGKPPNPMGY